MFKISYGKNVKFVGGWVDKTNDVQLKRMQTEKVLLRWVLELIDIFKSYVPHAACVYYQILGEFIDVQHVEH